MGRLAVILDTIRGTRNKAQVTDVKGDPGGGAIAQAEQFNSAGDDTNPLPGDYALFVEHPRGGYASAGNLDPNNAQTAQPGERRIYGRNSEGVQVCEIHFKNSGEISLSNDEAQVVIKADGTIESVNSSAAVTINPSGEVATVNGSGFYTLLASGTVSINGFTIQPDGTAASPTAITAPVMGAATSLMVAGAEVLGHDHPAGTPPGNTGSMNV